MMNYFKRSPLLLFFPLFVCNGLIAWYVSPLPIYPDEKTHFDYVEYIATHGNLPGIDAHGSIRNRFLKLNISQSGNYIEGATGITEKLLDRARPEKQAPTNLDTIRALTYPPAYYILGAFLANIFSDTDSLYDLFAFLRLYSLSLWLIAILTAYLLVKAVFPNDRLLQAWSLAVVGFTPMFASMGVAVNSDVLAILVMTVVLWQCVLLLKSNSWKGPRAAVTLALCVLATAVKPQLIIALFFFAIALLMQQAGRESLTTRKTAAIALFTLAVGTLTAYAYSAYFKGVQGYSIFTTMQYVSLPSLLKYVLLTFWHMFFFPVAIFWGNPSPSYVYYEFWMYLMPEPATGFYNANMFFIIVTLFFIWGGFVGVAWKIMRGKTTREESFVIVASLIWWVWIVTLTYFFFDRDLHMQGRYFFPVIAAAIPALVSGWNAYPRFFVRMTGRGMILFMIIFLEYEMLKFLMLEHR